jgi:hypothetical protein
MNKILGILLASMSPAAFAVVEVPEPGTMALFGAAAIGAGLAGHLAKRSKKK